MFKVCNNGKEYEFASKEELILYFMRREPIHLGFYSEEALRKYTPRLFDQVAMNPNDCYHPGMTGRAMQGEFWHWIPSQILPRTIMVYEDNRIIDIRKWLPEFQACLIHLKRGDYNPHHRIILSGSKPTHTKTYRIVHGYRQSHMPLSQPDQEDIMEVLGYIPDKLQRHASRMDDNIRTKRPQRSWKEHSKARKNWQRHMQPGSSQSIRKLGQDLEEWVMSTEEDETREILDALYSYCDDMDYDYETA